MGDAFRAELYDYLDPVSYTHLSTKKDKEVSKDRVHVGDINLTEQTNSVTFHVRNNNGCLLYTSGTRIPEIVYGFGATVSYKSFDLGVFFQGTGKTDQLLGGETWLPGASLGAGNIYSNIDNRWTPENPRQDVFLSLIHI